jgi:hypothetical protein
LFDLRRESTKERWTMGSEKKPLSDNNVKALQAAFKRDYEETGNPLHLLMAFQFSYRNRIHAPQWILDHLYTFFDQYIKSQGELPLDKIMGFSRGTGQTSIFKGLTIKNRDFVIMSMIHDLQNALGLSVAVAARIATSYIQSKSWFEKIPGPEDNKNEYSARWKTFFPDIPSNPTSRTEFQVMEKNFYTYQKMFYDFADRPTKRRYREKIATRRTDLEKLRTQFWSEKFYQSLGDTENAERPSE